MENTNKDAVMERAAEYGTYSVTNKEIISLIAGVPEETIEKLVDVYGDIHGALKNAKPVEGEITGEQATIMNMLFEFHGRTIKKDPLSGMISGPQMVHDIYQREMESYDVEHIFLLAMNTKNMVIKKVLLSKGVKNGTLFSQSEALKEAIMLNAHSVMLMHNHPSGVSKPSSDDILVTRKFMEAGKTVGIKVLDHIVFGRNEYTSIAELLQEMDM